MKKKFIHTADIHLGKTYRDSPGENVRYEDMFACLSGIVNDALASKVDFVLISGDLFHTGQILPKTFARTIEILQPLKDAQIPCVTIEGNHDWIHRRNAISWMEALAEMGYTLLLRPDRKSDGGYCFEPVERKSGVGGHVEIGGVNIYGIGYIGAQAGTQVERICEAVKTENNILLFHVGIWKYSPVEIGNMKIEEALPLAEKFNYIALGHGHKPYIIQTPSGTPFAYNPGAPERVNFGEERYDKGYYSVTIKDSEFTPDFKRTHPRPMMVEVINLDGANDADSALEDFRSQVKGLLSEQSDKRAPLIELKLLGRVGFHPFELGRERLRLIIGELSDVVHVEIKNHLSLVANTSGKQVIKKSLAEIEHDVLNEIIESHTKYQVQSRELAELSIMVRDLVLKGDVDDEELIGLLPDLD